MTGIGEYFMSIIAASVITALVSLAFGDDKALLSKGVNIACSLFMLCVIVAPISSFVSRAKSDFSFGDVDLGGIADVKQTENALYASLGEISGDQIEKALRDHIVHRSGIKTEDIDVRAEVSVEEGDVILKRVILSLYAGARWCDPRVLTDAVGELTDAECLIVNGE